MVLVDQLHKGKRLWGKDPTAQGMPGHNLGPAFNVPCTQINVHLTAGGFGASYYGDHAAAFLLCLDTNWQPNQLWLRQTRGLLAAQLALTTVAAIASQCKQVRELVLVKSALPERAAALQYILQS